MTVLVTGVAGFIGARVAQMLLDEGTCVLGIDSLSDHLYPREDKERRLTQLRLSPCFTLVEADLVDVDLVPILRQCEVVIHEAAVPGLTLSWERFCAYAHNNIMATERLLQAITRNPSIHLVHASTSSVYGLNALGDEGGPLNPVSPYGVTKLAAEHLVDAYAANFGVRATTLRYFSVYGPSQRPDMAYERFCEDLVTGRTITITGDGHQSRTNTHIDDVARATISAAHRRLAGETMNICGNQEMELLDVIDLFADEIGVAPKLAFEDPRPGDQYRTSGDASKAQALLEWSPTVPLERGLRDQARNVAARLSLHRHRGPKLES